MRLRSVLAATAALSLVAPTAEARGCVHLGVRWGSFQAPVLDVGPVFFYHSAEPAATAGVPVTVKGVGDDCSDPPTPVVATYRVADPPPGTTRVATGGLDYTPITPRNTGPLYGYHAQGPTEHTDTVALLPDLIPETVVEQAQAVISGTNDGGRLEVPSEVPLYVIDDDGTERASFEGAGPYERSETYGSVVVPVFRAGPAAGAADYALTVEGSSQNPASPDDYTAPGTVSFGPGQRVELLTIELANDRAFEPAEELTLTLTEPGTVLPDDPVRATVRILDSIGEAGLESRLHHPRNRLTYGASDYRLREIHIFTSTGQGAPITDAFFALRKNLRGGCEWWTGKRFRPGECQDERWLATRQYEPDFFYIRLKELAPSRGAIKSYTAYSRAENAAGALEPFLQVGRNQNTFEVKSPR